MRGAIHLGPKGPSFLASTDKKKAMSNLQSLLEKRATGEITSEKVLDHVRAALNVADNPIFEATFGSTAKKRFEEARDLMNTL